MFKSIKLLIYLFFISLSLSGFSQTLKFKVKDIPDSTVYLIRYYGPGLFMVDTTKSKKGKFEFDATNLPTGLYAVAFYDNSYFELVYDKQDVSMKVGDYKNALETSVEKKSVSNQLFYEYALFYSDQSKKIYDLNTRYKDYGEGTAQWDTLVFKVDSINSVTRSYQQEIRKKYPQNFVTQLIWLTYWEDLPEPPKDANGIISDSSFQYNYFIQHYWDGIDFSQTGMVYSPVYHNKLNKYFSSAGLIQNPDTIIKYSDLLLSKMDISFENELFRYTLHHIIYKYDTMRIVGMDKVFWHLSEYYYCPPNNKVWWVDSAGLSKMCYYNDRIENILIGNYAVPLTLTDSTEKNWIALYDIVADYSVLWFWSPTCGHCKTETPLLEKLYTEKLKPRNIEVYAIGEATGNDFELWKSFIRDNHLSFINVGLTKHIFEQAMIDPTPLLKHTTIESLNCSMTYDVFSTPKLFLLDKNKKILFKDISLAQLEMIIDDLTGHTNDEKILK